MTYKHIEVVPYNPDWPHQFTKEAAKIKLALGDNAIEIHHIGSTSVPGLSAKPKIDILAVVKNSKASLEPIQKLIRFIKNMDISKCLLTIQITIQLMNKIFLWEKYYEI